MDVMFGQFCHWAFGYIFEYLIWSWGWDICVILSQWPEMTFYFFSTQPHVYNWGHIFWVLSCVYLDAIVCSSWRVLENFFWRNILVSNISWLFTSASLTSTTDKKKEKRREMMRNQQGAMHDGEETKRCAHICTAFEGTWRHLESLFFSTSFFFLKLASQEGELWAFISEWKACGWHPEQRGLSAWPRQTSVPGLYSKILEQGEGLWWKWGGRGWWGRGKGGGGGVRGGLGCVFFFMGEIFEEFLKVVGEGA